MCVYRRIESSDDDEGEEAGEEEDDEEEEEEEEAEEAEAEVEAEPGWQQKCLPGQPETSSGSVSSR